MRLFYLALFILFLSGCVYYPSENENTMILQKADSLVSLMTIEEKIGQMTQQNAGDLDGQIKMGQIGSILNEVDVKEINRLQKIAVEQSRLGIPILFARDVIHGFRTIMPIPLGQSATWNPALVKKGARVAAVEARSSGIRWTFAPMIDITRDPRWGRIAEGLGEDPYLAGILGAAMTRGFQGDDLRGGFSLLACPKHFAAYGASEGGRDYHTVTLPENEFREVYLPPFKSSLDAGALTVMAGFHELNGIPVSGNDFLTNHILRNEWDFQGFVISDWSSVSQLSVHGFTANDKESAEQAVKAGVDMEMASTCYADHIDDLISEGLLSEQLIDEAVKRILFVKFKIGLFENPFTTPEDYPAVLNSEHTKVAKELAKQSLVLLKNDKEILPIERRNNTVAVIGPLADSRHDQMGTWVFDGEKEHTITPLVSITNYMGNKKVNYAEGLELSRTLNRNGFPEAIKAARNSDITLLFIGEESILSGESHCRADIGLPGLQEELVVELSNTGTPIIAVIMAGRPLTFEQVLHHFDAVIYAWHPGTMGGPAITDILFGLDSPSGKLPVTFPRVVGQIPIYYSQKNSGKPANDSTWEKMYDIPAEAPQLSIGNTNHYLDYGFEPLYHFGYGLSYTTFEYSDIKTSSTYYSLNDTILISASVTNTGIYEAEEVVQLYIRDIVASRTRPVRQLKGFSRISLSPGERQTIHFKLHPSELAFYNRNMEFVTEEGKYHAWIGGDSKADLRIEFEIKN